MNCPYCGNNKLEQEDDYDDYLFCFYCLSCDCYFYVIGGEYQDVMDEGLGSEEDGAGVCGILEPVKSRSVQREPIFKHYKYFIKADKNKEGLQDMAFAFGYEWSSSGKKYQEMKFNYMSLIPETKKLQYWIGDYPSDEKEIDMRGFVQLLNGNEPCNKPEPIEVNGHPVRFNNDGSVIIFTHNKESILIPHATLIDILETATGEKS